MLKPEMLENLIRSELEKADRLLWQEFPSDSTVPAIVKEIYKHRIKHKTHFFWANLTLLMAKSLTSTIPKPIIRVAAIMEILVIGRALKQEALRSQWTFSETSFAALNDAFMNTPGILDLAADYLIAYSLKSLATFNVNYFVQGFALAQKDFIESELLLKTNSARPQFTDTDYLALIKLRMQNFSTQLASGISKLCLAPQEIEEGLCHYAQHFGMAVALYIELIPLYSSQYMTTPGISFLKLSSLNYPILYALKRATEEEQTLIKDCFKEVSSQRMGMIKPVCKILERYSVAQHILDLIKNELQTAGRYLNELNYDRDQALHGLLEMFIQQCTDQSQIFATARNL